MVKFVYKILNVYFRAANWLIITALSLSDYTVYHDDASVPSADLKSGSWENMGEASAATNPRGTNLKVLASLLLLGTCAFYSANVDGAKILAAYPFPGKSHFMMHNALIQEVIQRGHQVTMITAFSLSHLKLGSNYTEILIEPVYDFWDDVKHLLDAGNLFELTSMDFYDFFKMLDIIGTKTTEHALKQPKVQELINAQETEGVFDLLLTEQFYQEAFLAFAVKYNVPFITSTTLGYANHMSQIMGIVSPWSFVPHGFLPYTDQMSFFQRLWNSYYSLYEDLNREFVYFPKMDAIMEKYFGHLNLSLPRVNELDKKVSLMLLNSYAPLTTPRPTSDAMIPVGGLHIYPPKPLPSDIQTFLDGANDGVIYFSLGSNVQSKDMPSDKLEMFLNVFRNMKQRIVWKFENESLPNAPSNVLVKKWLPQSDILAHPNVKVFITHGGLFGTQEGVYHAVPMLGMPFYCDQHLNMNKAVLGGYAISLHFQSITHEILHKALVDLMDDPKYKQNIQRISNIFRDRPMPPRETAVYWIEYVIRHKGAPHLHAVGQEMVWYKFYLLDVVGFIVLLPFILIWIFRGSRRTKNSRKKSIRSR